jgi:glutathione synthase/RimK-type ligase-like ATP-grasp enzyme
VNHPDDLVRAEYKPWQLQAATRHGLRCPRTMVTNDPRAARAFFEQCEGRVIYKTLSASVIVDEAGDGHGVYTSAVHRRHLSADHAVRATSCLFQEHIGKELDLRVTIVGRSAISVAIHSQERASSMLDWRSDQNGLRHSLHELPQDVRDRCLALVGDLNLRFAAVDMIVTPAGEYVFIEVNPNGQWAWLEDVTAVNIHDALADELCRPAACDSEQRRPSSSPCGAAWRGA